MTLKTLDVIWYFDETIEPPKHKMAVCVEPDEGWFFRINTRNFLKPCFPISKDEHPFLKHDSFVNCDLLILDDFIIDEALCESGPTGSLSISILPVLKRTVIDMRYISLRDKQAILAKLNAI